MTSPNEPGAPNTGDLPNGDAVAERAGAHRATTGPGRASEPVDAASRHRGGAWPSQPGQWQPNDPPTDVRPPGPSSAVDARLNRFITGTSAPSGAPSGPVKTSAPEPDDVPARSDGPPVEAYASELPDLSGPIPRAQRRSAPDRPVDAPATTTTASRAVTTESRESRVQVSPRRGRGPVRASMQIRRIDPWSTLKVSLLLSVALFFVWMISVAFLYLVLGGMGVWAKLNSNVGDLLNNTSGSSAELVSSGTIFGGAVLIGLVNIVLMTAMATIGAFVYNLTTDLIGGIEVTLADRD
ncbi:DUF3566 domain-containing protein [Mycobacterium kansasii]|uniref:DUF3566 domain-containing protein n=2 Tax=Mycobacterium kansasii TaxID=1768 RepID=A0A653EQY9_MYCKA|nr:DUF3566 domain-containing protein [Mycobacterium kansasii]AGZ51410.1 hypothetical protein MKAN_14875 [Mycobacterium kansasii ATCC 12478]ARG56860.1 hypothetical protein B1T43_14390 [Mycobacterium kansasii]ARG62349.1 hypothetical protein B1T45_14745 [Mycobacterium kansasii]ARG70015.1 hypothetical protein B1T47_14220 [Mycobacterium kansasii]ARG75417.1 hypothetical protein B1T51_14115 [Mycobacterium kansasii]